MVSQQHKKWRILCFFRQKKTHRMNRFWWNIYVDIKPFSFFLLFVSVLGSYKCSLQIHQELNFYYVILCHSWVNNGITVAQKKEIFSFQTFILKINSIWWFWLNISICIFNFFPYLSHIRSLQVSQKLSICLVILNHRWVNNGFTVAQEVAKFCFFPQTLDVYNETCKVKWFWWNVTSLKMLKNQLFSFFGFLSL